MEAWGKIRNSLSALELMKPLKYCLLDLMQSAERLHLSQQKKESLYSLTYLSVLQRSIVQ